MRYFIVLFLMCVGLNAQQIDHSKWTSFLQQHVSEYGNVDYKVISKNPSELNRYLNEFVNIHPNVSWTKNETLAYWINAYNAFTIKLIIDNYPVKSINDISQPWDKKFIPINGKSISLNYIEHEILRKMNEPRIHFAINCASISCPKLLNEAYVPETLDGQLDNAAKEFINSNKNKLTSGNIKISKIFKWFKKDFETNGSIIDFINNYSEIKLSSKEKIGYLDYNWSLNE
ncbi:DUF547 domain-containing protein [Yeosuana sp. MJ-SS3]|uniref:DUF547 domain-containing protein n=1 Tax=Gilvirhabdus luticola TaxID=3079858 RepID=A0ABU3U411_9FLAO|nr:DUF547 domain-containing protein [Yeosuana sp. MJ-SS3]MDU8885151.1 DUF547 domain-containing protein [Yeosuana sp. MJ-SS3]